MEVRIGPHRLILGDCLEVMRRLPDCSVNCCVTSPPYWGLRDYGHAGQIGLEATPEEYVSKIVEVFAEVRRLLTHDGTLWVNIGDTYYGGGRGGNPSESTFKKQATNYGSLVARTKVPIGCKPKDLVGIPWRVAFALQADGWYLRQDIIWHKPNPMPESVRDRCTKSHEYMFLLAKSQRYAFDCQAIAENAATEPHAPNWSSFDKNTLRKDRNGGEANTRVWIAGVTRNKRSVWTVTTKPYAGAHFATFPTELIDPCILAGCPEGGTVLDPFAGSGTSGVVAAKLARKFIGIELNETYLRDLAAKRISAAAINAESLFEPTVEAVRQPDLFAEVNDAS